MKLWLLSLGLFLFIRVRRTDGNIRIASFFFEATAEVIVSAIYGAGSAGALHEIVPVLGFDFVAADIATDGVFDDHWLSSLNSSFMRCAPY